MVFRLIDELVFPDPRGAEDDGLLAVGGDLSEDRLLLGYSHGIFPWFGFRERDEPRWYCPRERFVIFPDEVHVSHSLRTLLNSGRLEVSFNKDFEGVIQGCSVAQNRIDHEGAWLGPEMIEAYTALHRRGYASSVEVWEEGRLVGGLYGVNVGYVFCGESMFSLRPSASKVALVALGTALATVPRRCVIDCQFETPHLRSMGGRYISYDRYISILRGEDE